MANKSQFFARIRTLQFRANQAQRYDLRADLDRALKLYTDGKTFSAGELAREIESKLAPAQAAHN